MIDDIKDYAKVNRVPIIKDGGLEFLLQKIEEYDAKNILELGTAIAYSAINMARLSKDIQIDTIERDEKLYHEALINIEKEGLSEQIHPYFMDIKDFKTDKIYDLIFVDAAKGQYYNYLEQFYNNLKTGGAYFFDNLVFHDMIYDVDSIKNRNTRQLVKKILKFRHIVQDDTRFDIILRDDIGDGVCVLIKKEIKNEG